ncbi:hypothetical protein D9M68_766500 [compost metagenome]
MAVAGGARHFHVELEVGGHGVGVAVDRQLERRQRGGHVLQVGVVAALRGQAGGFALQADAQLQQRDHVGHGGEVFRGDAEVGLLLARRHHEGADAVARFHQARGLQPRNGFAHHGAAHVETAHQLGLGGQLVAGTQAAFTDVAAQRLDDLGHQPARAARARSHRRRLGGGRHQGIT